MSYNANNICGSCYLTAAEHNTNGEPNEFYCSRDCYSIGNDAEEFAFVNYGSLDSYEDLDSDGIPMSFVIERIALLNEDTYDGDAYVPDTLNPDEWDRIDNYRDLKPDEHTYAIDWTYVTPNGQTFHGTYADDAKQRQLNLGNVEPRSRSVYIEGHDGYATEVVYDDHLTELYQNRLLNLFTNKAGRVQIGSVQLLKCSDGTIDARCVRNDCQARMNSGHFDSDRLDMEAFTLSVIRHGNNHAASWFINRVDKGLISRTIIESVTFENGIQHENWITNVKSRKPSRTFYKLHAEGCDLNCDPKAAHCTVQVDAAKLRESMAHKPVSDEDVKALAATLNTRPFSHSH